MELMKKNIHMDRVRFKAGTQITLENDMNIPDVKPDVSNLVCERGQVKIDEIKPMTDHVLIRGKLQFTVLYQTKDDGVGVACFEGNISFEEQLFMEGITPSDSVEISKELEDITVGIINSRKLSIQAVISLNAYSQELYDEETAIDIYQNEDVEYRKEAMDIASVAIQKNDIFRVKEEGKLPPNYPNIFEIIWSSVNLGDVEFKVLEEKISVQGEVNGFFLYEAEGEEQAVRTFEMTIPFSGVMECHGCRENMIPDIHYEIGHLDVEVRPDLDGEERVVGIEMVLDISIRLYEEEMTEILSDVYMVTHDVEVDTRPAEYKKLLMRGNGKCKVADHIKLESDDAKILQLIHSEGTVMIDRYQIIPDAIEISGSISLLVIYVTGNDTMPYGSLRGVIPFTYTLEAQGIDSNAYIKLDGILEQLNVTMLDSEELDVKAVVAIKAVVFDMIKAQVIAAVNVKPIDSKVMCELPGIAIYYVKPGDNLWNIGKQYYVSVSAIKELNHMAGDEVKAGDKLLIVKGAGTT